MSNDYHMKVANSWPHRVVNWLKNGITTKFSTLTGRMQQDGIVYSCNEPVLVKKEWIHVLQPGAGAVTFITLPEWLGCPAAELKNYRLDFLIYYDDGGTSATGDDLQIFGMAGATIEEGCLVVDHGDFPATSSRDQPIKVSVYPTATHTHYTVDNINYASGSANLFIVVLAYRMPDNICIA